MFFLQILPHHCPAVVRFGAFARVLDKRRDLLLKRVSEITGDVEVSCSIFDFRTDD